MTATVKFSDGYVCYDADWKEREMSTDEITTVEDMVRGYSNVTITGVHICDERIVVNFAVNRHSKARYPKNHREYQEVRSVKKEQWRGWS